MSERPHGDDLLHAGIATVLRAGTLVAVAMIGVGLGWAIAAGSPGRTDQSVIDAIASGGPDALVSVGLLGLALVPIAAVAVAAAGLRRAGDARLAALAAIVLVLLIGSLVAAAIVGAAAGSAAG